MRVRTFCSAVIPFVASLSLLFAGAGCPPSPAAVGAPCDLGVPTSGGDGVTISSPALECAGGICLQVGSAPALCSSECGSEDDCGNRASGSNASCQHGFKCAAATAVGTYACRRLCVCRDVVSVPPACGAPL
jgi:hypothetical protein